MTNKPKSPDRTEILVSPAGGFLAAVCTSALLIYYSHSHHHGGREKLIGALIRGLAELMGPTVCLVVSAALVIGVGIPLVRSIQTYRALVAADRKAAGL